MNRRNAFGVEWPAVGYYSSRTDKRNTFELVIIDRSDITAGAFDFEFNCDSMQRETGEASGGNGLGGDSARVPTVSAAAAMYRLSSQVLRSTAPS